MGTCSSKSTRYARNSVGGGDAVDNRPGGGGRGGGSGSGSVGDDAFVKLPDLHSAAVFDVTAVPGPSGGYDPAVFVTCGDDNRVVVTDWATGCVLAAWTAHGKCVNRVATGGLPSSQRLVTASRDLTVRVWNRADTAAPVRTFEGHTLTVVAAEFSPGASTGGFWKSCTRFLFSVHRRHSLLPVCVLISWLIHVMLMDEMLANVVYS